MIAVQSNALSLAGLFNIPQSRGCTGSRHSAKKSSQYLSKPDIHQPNICPMFHQQSDFMQQYAPAREAIQAVIPRGGERFFVAGGVQEEGFSNITTRRDNFVVAKKKDSTANAILSTTANEYQPFGSMPNRSSSLRPSVFSQLAKLIPDSAATDSNCSLSSGVIRILNCGDCPSPFGLLSRFIIDRWSPIKLILPSLGGHLITVLPTKTMPRSAPTLTGHLTTTDSIIIEVAEMDHTTHPKGRHSVTQNTGTAPVSFVWIIAAVRRDCPTVKATIHHIAAATEREARRTLAKDHVCFFAGRIRQGVSHA